MVHLTHGHKSICIICAIAFQVPPRTRVFIFILHVCALTCQCSKPKLFLCPFCHCFCSQLISIFLLQLSITQLLDVIMARNAKHMHMNLPTSQGKFVSHPIVIDAKHLFSDCFEPVFQSDLEELLYNQGTVQIISCEILELVL